VTPCWDRICSFGFGFDMFGSNVWFAELDVPFRRSRFSIELADFFTDFHVSLSP